MITIDLLEDASAEYSSTPEEIQATRDRIASANPAELSTQEQFERRKEMIAATAVEPIVDAFERLVGESELLPINYLLLGYLQSQAVGRIRYFDRREGEEAVATGFLVAENLLMTNHHVFPVLNAAEFDAFAQDAVIEFNYEYDVDGNRSTPVVFPLDPHRFLHTAKPLDMALVAVQPTDTTGAHQLKNQGYLVLDGSLGKAIVGDFASIIQHPGGREKQIAIRKNEIINSDLSEALIYVSDTAQGSSGAPVFNDQWQVIALHSAGVAKKNAQGEYVDKNGEVVRPVNGRVDEKRLVWESNRGIRVSSMIDHLRETPAATNALIQPLFSPAYTDSRPFAALSRPKFDIQLASSPAVPVRDVVAATPTTPVAPTAPINININVGPGGPVVTTTTGAPMVAPLEAAIAFERQTIEDQRDFSDCAGFDERFMGVRIPMPTPSAGLRKKLAFLKDSPSAYTLKYHHVSTLHHAVRRVPVVSGVNVNGKMRFSNLSGENKWYRDNRIDYDVQLNDTFYTRSGFDRGHLARREDAEWGSTRTAALAAADLTASFANAVPQVPALNQASRAGEWGRLEVELLERGVENEREKASRICVFNGPLFDNDDPVFKGVQIAVSFYKVVVWYDGDENLRTTCYVLSQEELVGEIEFEVLRFDDIFTTAQVPIHQIEKTTGLNFPAIVVDNDTFTE